MYFHTSLYSSSPHQFLFCRFHKKTVVSSKASTTITTYYKTNSSIILLTSSTTGIKLRSALSKVLIKQYPEARAGEWSVVGIFDDFVGDINGASDPLNWNNSICEIHLLTNDATPLKNAITYLKQDDKPWLPQIPYNNGLVDILNFYDYSVFVKKNLEQSLKAWDSNEIIQVIPAVFTAQLYIGSNSILTNNSMPIEHLFKFGVHPDAHAKFHIQQLGEVFSFPSSPKESSTTKLLFNLVRWLLLGFTVVSIAVAFRMWFMYGGDS